MRSLSGSLAAVALGSAMSAHGMAADVPAVNPLLVEPVERLRPDEVRFMQQRLADWPELHRYRDANARLPATVPGQPRVVLFGDSITEGWGREGSGTLPLPRAAVISTRLRVHVHELLAHHGGIMLGASCKG